MSAKLILKTILLIFGVLITINALNFGYETFYRLIHGKANYSTKTIFRVPNSKVEIVLERRAAHLFLAEYERTLVLKNGGKEILRREATVDSGDFSRMYIYRISPTEYFFSGIGNFDKYKLNVARQEIVLPVSDESFSNAKFIGAFDQDTDNVWRFISASERDELKNKS